MRIGRRQNRTPASSLVPHPTSMLAAFAIAAFVAPGIVAAGQESAVVSVRRAQPSAALQRDARDKHVEKAVAVGGRTVWISSYAGNLDVRPGTDNQARVVVDLEYWSSDEEWMETVDREFDVEIRESGQRIEIEPTSLADLERPGLFERLLGQRRVSYSMEISLTVPAGTPLDIENRYGDVRVADIGGPIELVNTSGEVSVSGIVGNATIENSYGDLGVVGVEGDLVAVSNSGQLAVEGVSGNADLSNQYGDVRVLQVDGDLELQATSAAVRVDGVGGDANISNSYGDVEVRTVAGRLELGAASGDAVVVDVGEGLDLRNSYGSIEVEDVDGDVVVRGTSTGGSIRRVAGSLRADSSYGDLLIEEVGGTVDVSNSSGGVTVVGAGASRISSSYSPIRAQRIRGSLEIEGTSAAIEAEQIDGGVDIRTSYDGVRVVGVGGAVTIRNQSGRVQVEGLSGAALTAHHRIETSYDDVELEWPAADGMTFTLECSYCRISSDYEGSRQQRGSRELLEGQVGTGSPASVEITVQSGSIALRRR